MEVVITGLAAQLSTALLVRTRSPDTIFMSVLTGLSDYTKPSSPVRIIIPGASPQTLFSGCAPATTRFEAFHRYFIKTRSKLRTNTVEWRVETSLVLFSAFFLCLR